MNRYLLILMMTGSMLTAQKKIPISNRSFEDIPRQGINTAGFRMSGWTDCGSFKFPGETPPDVHPGKFWENETPPSDGNTYIGMVVRENETNEGIGQRLSIPLKTGMCYKFTIDLARSPKYISGKNPNDKNLYNYNQPTVFRIWGGTGLCDDKQLLAESKPIDHPDWRTYQFKIKPKADYKFIFIEAFYKVPVISPYSGHILVDNLSDFDEMDFNSLMIE